MLYHVDILNCEGADMGPVVGFPTLLIRKPRPQEALTHWAHSWRLGGQDQNQCLPTPGSCTGQVSPTKVLKKKHGAMLGKMLTSPLWAQLD